MFMNGVHADHHKHGCGKLGCKDKRNLSFGTDSDHKTSLLLPFQFSALTDQTYINQCNILYMKKGSHLLAYGFIQQWGVLHKP